jgi:hypothetical protein
MMEIYISIHSYFGCFHEKGNKMRPAFRDENGILWALTHSVPKDVPFITIPKKDIQGEHFKPKKEVVFLLKARNQNARRYNNSPGGIIKIKNSIIKMEKTIKFIPVQLPTATELGLSPEGASQVDTINATLQKQLRGEPLDEFEKQYTELPGWDAKVSAFLTTVVTAQVSATLVGNPTAPTDLSDSIDLLNQLTENPEDSEALELLAIEWGMEVPKVVDLEAVTEVLDSVAQSAHDQKEVAATEAEETTNEQITEETPATEEVTAETPAENLPAPQKPIINAVGAASTLEKLKKTNEHLKAASSQMIDVLKNINEAMVGQLEATTEFAEQVIADQQALPVDAETAAVEESAG